MKQHHETRRAEQQPPSDEKRHWTTKRNGDGASDHQRMDERVATQAQVTRFMNELGKWLQGRFPTLSDDLVHDAACDAVIEWYRRGISDPLPARIVYTAAWRNAANQYRSERARVCRERLWQIEHMGGGAPAHDVSEACRAILTMLPDDRMKTVFRLRLAGVRASSEYAAALGESGQEPLVQRRIVKREQDRLMKLLRHDGDIQAIAKSAIGAE